MGVAVGAVEAVPLARNRNYRILWSGMLVSELVAESAYIAFPLLVMAHGGSAWEVAAVVSALAAARMVATVPAGVIADRWDRRKLMLISHGVRAAAALGLVGALFAGYWSVPLVVLAAVLEGVFSSAFQPAEHAALPQVVPAGQLNAALARNAARPFAALLVGPALAGLTFGIHQLVPFSVAAALLVAGLLTMLRLRLPPRPAPAGPAVTSTRAELAEAFVWLLRQPVLRVTVCWIVGVNVAIQPLILISLVAAGESDVGYGEMGLMMTCFGVGGLAGGLLGGRLHGAIPAPVSIIGSSWAFVAAAAALAVVPPGLPTGAVLAVAAAFLPVASTTIVTYQLSVVPDALRGRLTGVVGLCSELASTAGPLVGGLLLATWGAGPASTLAAAGLLAVVAAGATLSPRLRRFPTAVPPTGTAPQVPLT